MTSLSSLELSAKIYHLQLQGRLIRTTAEHPFWVKGKGWTATKYLQSYDEVMSLGGEWLRIDKVEELQIMRPSPTSRREIYLLRFCGQNTVGVHTTHEVIVETIERSAGGSEFFRIIDPAYGSRLRLPLDEFRARFQNQLVVAQSFAINGNTFQIAAP